MVGSEVSAVVYVGCSHDARSSKVFKLTIVLDAFQVVGSEVSAVVRHPLSDLPQQAAALLSAGTMLFCQHSAGRVHGLLPKQRLVLPGDKSMNVSVASWLLCADLVLQLFCVAGLIGVLDPAAYTSVYIFA